MSIKIVISDDHPLVLNGLEQLLEAEKDFSVVARCATGEKTLKALCKQRPDILVLDIHMPDKNGWVVLQEMKEKSLATRVVLFSAAVEDEELLQAVRLGASGVVMKDTAAGSHRLHPQGARRREVVRPESRRPRPGNAP